MRRPSCVLRARRFVGGIRPPRPPPCGTRAVQLLLMSSRFPPGPPAPAKALWMETEEAGDRGGNLAQPECASCPGALVCPLQLPADV